MNEERYFYSKIKTRPTPAAKRYGEDAYIYFNVIVPAASLEESVALAQSRCLDHACEVLEVLEKFEIPLPPRGLNSEGISLLREAMITGLGVRMVGEAVESADTEDRLEVALITPVINQREH